MGNIGSTYIMSFGDTIPCIAFQDQCVDLEAPNSAGIVTSSDNDTQYTDVNVDGAGHAEIFCPMVDGEPPSFGLGLSNVVETSDEQGIVFFTRDNRSTPAGEIVGSGVAFINITSGKPVCTRPNVQWWNSTVEPYFGDHNVILSPQDNYIYAYGGLLNPGYGQNVFLARVPQWGAPYLWAYQYWNGTAFTTDRLINPSTDAAVFWAGQGSIMWSEYYQKYLYFQPGCPGGACILVTVADNPWGLWSESVSVWGSGDSPDGLGSECMSLNDGAKDSVLIWHSVCAGCAESVE